MRAVLRVGWFTSAWDQQALVLLDVAIARSPQAGYEITDVLLTRNPAKSAVASHVRDLAERAGVRVSVVPAIAYRDESVPEAAWRTAFEEAIVTALAPSRFDVVVLAGYMWIAHSTLIDTFRMINLHPALPGGPSGVRDEILRRLVQEGTATTGAMVHVVTEELDRGDPLVVVEFPVVAEGMAGTTPERRVDDLRWRLLSAEPILIATALELLSRKWSRTSWPPDGEDWPVLLGALS